MSVFDLQELPLFGRNDEQTVLPGNDAMVVPVESGVSLDCSSAGCPSNLSALC
jgi:hypothetical protein